MGIEGSAFGSLLLDFTGKVTIEGDDEGGTRGIGNELYSPNTFTGTPPSPNDPTSIGLDVVDSGLSELCCWEMRKGSHEA